MWRKRGTGDERWNSGKRNVRIEPLNDPLPRLDERAAHANGIAHLFTWDFRLPDPLMSTWIFVSSPLTAIIEPKG
jgi:hypothetical protein